MTKTVFKLCWLVLVALLFGWWLGAATGWALLALALLWMVLAQSVQRARIARWVRRLDDPPPPAVGAWDEVLAAIYRRLKRDRQELQHRTHNLQQTLLAADALPDGALTLAADKSLLWCNQTAAVHLDLDPVRDRGHSILNIVRDPAFARYAAQTHWDAPLTLQITHGTHTRTLRVYLAPYGADQLLLVTREPGT